MAQVAPEDCLVYFTWAALAQPVAENNPTERWLAQDELQKALTGLRDLLREQLIAINGEAESGVRLAENSFDVIETILTSATAVFVTRVEVVGGDWRVDGGMLTNLGAKSATVREKLEAIPALLEDDLPAEQVEIDGASYWRWQVDPAVSVYWTIDGDYLIAGLSEQSIREIRAAWDRPAPDWLVDIRARLPVDRVSTVSWVRVDELLRVSDALGNAESRRLVDELGLRFLKSAAWVTGLDSEGFVSKAEFAVERNATGIWEAIGSEPIRREQLARVPNDATIAILQQINWIAAYDVIEECNTNGGGAFQDMVDDFEQTMGASLREQLLPELAPTITLYGSPSMTSPTRGWIVTVDVVSDLSFGSLHQDMMDHLRMIYEERDDQETLVTKEVQGQTTYMITGRDGEPLQGMFDIDPCWAAAAGQWIGSLNQAALRRHLRGDGALESSIASRPEVQFVWATADAQRTGPISLAILDPKPFIENLLGLVEPMRMMAGDEQTQQMYELIPPVDVLTRDLGLHVSATYRTERGYEVIQRQTLPGGSPVITMAALGAGFVSAVPATRAAAARTESLNNVRQLILACHNYHDANKGMPAAYSTDDAGKPLLSWRVHILPYIEEEGLYREFHLDEPWDSEHNRTLIERMPAVFAHPALELEPGKTSYLAVTGEGAVFGPPTDPGDTSPVGISLEKIAGNDGTSRTIGIVEVGADQSVIWTQPDDFDITIVATIKDRLVGPWPRGAWIAGFCDGSVRLIDGATAAETVVHLLQYNDGQLTELDGPREPGDVK
jgi:hypothetical protein